jgi:hypothetical protein
MVAILPHHNEALRYYGPSKEKAGKVLTAEFVAEEERT